MRREKSKEKHFYLKHGEKQRKTFFMTHLAKEMSFCLNFNVCKSSDLYGSVGFEDLINFSFRETNNNINTQKHK
jgi:hypothetical protein